MKRESKEPGQIFQGTPTKSSLSESFGSTGAGEVAQSAPGVGREEALFGRRPFWPRNLALRAQQPALPKSVGARLERDVSEPACEAGAGQMAPPQRGTPGAAIARNAVFLVSGQIAVTALSIAFTAVLGRQLGPADYGLYYFAWQSMQFAYTVVEWGQTATLIQTVARFPSRAGAVLGSGLLMRVVGAVLAAGPAALAAKALGYDLHAQILVGLLVLAWAPTSMGQAFGQVFRGHERMGYDAALNVTNKALTVALAIPVLFLGGRLGAVVACIALAGWGMLAFATQLGKRMPLPRVEVRADETKELFRTGFPLMVLSVTLIAQSYIESALLSRLTPRAVVGWYGAARNVYGTLIMPAQILIMASFPRFARAVGVREDFRVEVSTALRPVLAMSALGVVGTYLFAPLAINVIYGLGGFAPAVDNLRLLAPTLFLLFFDMILGSACVAAGHSRSMTIVKLISLAVSAGVAWLLIPYCQTRYGNGAFGAIIAFGASELLMLTAFAMLIPRGVLTRRTLFDLGRAVLSGAISFGAVKALPWSTPFLGVPVCLGAFALGATATRLVSRSDVASLLGAIRRKRGPMKT